MNIYVGNLSRTVNEGDLELIFEGLGHLVFVRLAQPTEDSDARGYAFVAVADDRQAEIAVTAMNGKYLKGLRLIVRPVLDGARHARALRAHGSRPGTAAEPAPLLQLVRGGQAAD